MMYRMIFLTGPLKGQRIAIAREPMTLGRDPGCAVYLPDEEVAGRHAVIEHRADGLFIRDLGSMNKILLNQIEVRQSRLKHGDTVAIGRTELLVQALVEAGVSASGRRRRSMQAAVRWAAVVLVVLATGAAIAAWQQRLSRRYTEAAKAARLAEAAAPEPAAPSPAPETAAPAVSNTVPVAPVAGVAAQDFMPPVTDEIRTLRRDLSELRQVVDHMTTQQTAVALVTSQPVAAVAPPPPAEPANTATAVVASTPAAEPESPAPAPPTPKKPARPKEFPRLSIATLDQQRFPDNDEVDEMRVVKIVLAALPRGQEVQPDAVRVEVQFYDQDSATGTIHPTRAVAPSFPLLLQGTWPAGEPKTFSATYIVPKGFRDQEAKDGRRDQYAGYTVQLFYGGQIQDADARPKALLAYAAPAAGATNRASSTVSRSPRIAGADQP